MNEPFAICRSSWWCQQDNELVIGYGYEFTSGKMILGNQATNQEHGSQGPFHYEYIELDSIVDYAPYFYFLLVGVVHVGLDFFFYSIFKLKSLLQAYSLTVCHLQKAYCAAVMGMRILIV